MAKSRRKPPLTLSAPRLVVPLGFGAALAHFTQVTLYQQAHFAPDAVHPWDAYAALSLFCGMVSGAGLLLSLRDPAPMRWRRSRVPKRMPRRAKRRQGSGTMGK